MGLVHETKKDWLSTIIKPGADPGFTKGRAQIQYSEHDNHVRRHILACKACQILGVWHAPRKYQKIKPSEIESEGIFNGLLSLLLQDGTLLNQGQIQDSKKGGAQLCYCEDGNCVQSTQSGMQSMPNLGGSGGMPPQKILKN